MPIRYSAIALLLSMTFYQAHASEEEQKAGKQQNHEYYRRISQEPFTVRLYKKDIWQTTWNEEAVWGYFLAIQAIGNNLFSLIKQHKSLKNIVDEREPHNILVNKQRVLLTPDLRQTTQGIFVNLQAGYPQSLCTPFGQYWLVVDKNIKTNKEAWEPVNKLFLKEHKTYVVDKDKALYGIAQCDDIALPEAIFRQGVLVDYSAMCKQWGLCVKKYTQEISNQKK